MSTLPSVESSVVSIFHSLSFLDSLHFTRSENRVAAAALADPASFEGRHIRDAEEHERGLFRVATDTEYDGYHGRKPSAVAAAAAAATLDGGVDKDRLRRSILGRSTNTRNTSNRDASWTFAKRRGPERIPKPETATPLKRRRPHATGSKGTPNKDGEDSEAYLIAAKKLLEHYSSSGTSMTRAQEHLELLSSQYEGLMESIADFQEELEQPQPKQAPSHSTEGNAPNISGDLEALEAEIRREELEIFALKELKAEVDKEARDLAEALEARQPSERPLPKQNRFRRPLVPSTSEGTSTTISSRPSTKPSGSGQPNKEPSAVARKIAEAREKMAASRKRPEDATTTSATSIDDITLDASPINPESSHSTSDETIVRSEASPAVPSAEPEKQQTKPEPAIPVAQLEAIVTKIVSTMPPSTEQSQDAHQVLTQLAALISADPQEQTTLTPVQSLEYYLLHTYLTLLLSLPPANLSSSPSLIFRTPATSTSQKPEPMLSLNAIKTSLAEYAKGKGWNEDLGTKAVYGLVAKRVVKIDRSGRESLVGFTL